MQRNHPKATFTFKTKEAALEAHYNTYLEPNVPDQIQVSSDVCTVMLKFVSNLTANNHDLQHIYLRLLYIIIKKKRFRTSCAIVSITAYFKSLVVGKAQ